MMELKHRWGKIEEVFKPFMDKNQVALLIRGLPGTGKTTLALELMNLVKDKYNCIYISTRVSFNKLKQQIPWVEDILNDSTVLQLIDDNIRDKNGHDNPMSKGKGDSIDLRLSTADNLLNILIDRLVNYKRAFIVLDSWDSLAKEIPLDERMKIEKTMLAVADANDGMLVFISEEPEKNTLAYLVDCVITLTTEASNGVWLRKMQIDKMRGVAISRNRMVYTLHDGHFTITESKQNTMYKGGLFNAIASKQGYTSTGNKQLDDALGYGIRDGSIVMLEVDSSINMNYARIIAADAVLNNIRSNKPAMVICGYDEPLIKVLNKIVPYCLSFDLSRLMVFASPSSNYEQEFKRVMNELYTYDKQCIMEDMIMSLGYDNTENMALLVDSYIKLKDYGKSMIAVANLVWNRFEEIREQVLYSTKVIRNNDDVLILTVKAGSDTASNVAMLADVHIKLWEDDGTHILCIKKPFERLYAMSLDDANGYPSYSLLPLL
jgi:KaiC/GvpD/RAD55 family RecA-like ATPase